VQAWRPSALLAPAPTEPKERARAIARRATANNGRTRVFGAMSALSFAVYAEPARASARQDVTGALYKIGMPLSSGGARIE
jgi:hypothetical protein